MAKLLGYKSLPGGANKIIYFEERGIIKPDLMQRLAMVLGIDEATISKLAEEDRREQFERWITWANHPIRAYVSVKLLPAVYTQEQVPLRMIHDQEAMERFAAQLARKWKAQAMLVLSRRISIHFSAKGEKLSILEAGPGQPLHLPGIRFDNTPKEQDGD